MTAKIRKILTAVMLSALTCMCIYGWIAVSNLSNRGDQLIFSFFQLASTCLMIVTLILHLSVLRKKEVSKIRRIVNLLFLVLASIDVPGLSTMLVSEDENHEGVCLLLMVLSAAVVIVLSIIEMINSKKTAKIGN